MHSKGRGLVPPKKKYSLGIKKLFKMTVEMLVIFLALIGLSFPVAQSVKILPAMRQEDSIPGSGRSLGEENSNPLQYSCLENSMDRGAWWATVHGVTKSQTRLSD